jgi:hypothetical protein
MEKIDIEAIIMSEYLEVISNEMEYFEIVYKSYLHLE